MAGSLLPQPKQLFQDANWNPLIGGQIFTYAAGTLTPKTTYQDESLTIANTNPTVANARGEVLMFGNGPYRVILKDFFGMTIYDVDNVESARSIVDTAIAGILASFALPTGASLFGFKQPEATARTLSIEKKLRQNRCFDDYEGVDPTGSTDSTVGIQAALSNGVKHFDTSVGAIYTLSAEITIPDGVTIHNTGNAYFGWKGPDAQLPTGMFVSQGGSAIRMVNPIFRNLSENNLVAGFSGVACRDVMLISPKAYNCKVCLFNTSAAVYADVVTSGVGANVNRNITVTDFIAIGRGPALHGAAVDLFYCVDWRVSGGYARDIQFGVQFWGGDSNFAVNGALANERKNRHGTVIGVNCSNGMAGIWGSMGHGIQVIGCDVRVMADVGIDFEGCENSVATGCHAEECVNANYATFFYNTDVSFVSGTSRHTSEKPHYRSYNSSLTTNNKSVKFIDMSCVTVGAIGTIDCASGPVESIDVSDCTLTNTRISLASNNMRYVRVQNNTIIFTLPYGTNFDAILVGGAHINGRVRIEGNTIISQVAQPAGSVGVNAQTDDSNTVNYFEIRKNNVSGFSQDFILASLGGNAGIAPVFLCEGNVFGAGVLNRVEQGAGFSVVRLIDNLKGDFSHFPGAVPTSGRWDANTRIKLNAVAAGGYAEAICTATGTPGTWKNCNSISA